MKLFLKKIEGLEVLNFLFDNFNNLGYLPQALLEKVSVTVGEFYVIVPPNTDETFVYNLKTGGQVIPFHKIEGQNVYSVTNLADKAIRVFLYNFLNETSNSYIALEDFNSHANDERVKKSTTTYSIIEDHLFYLLNSSFSKKQLNDSLLKAVSWLFFGALVQIESADIVIKNYKNHEFLTEQTKDIISENIQAFFIEVYDGESFLFWIKSDRPDILHQLNQSLDAF